MVHHVISALTMMTKITNISMKNENDALLLDTYVKNDIEIAIVKEYFERH